MATLNINTDALVAYTNKLEKLHRSALPVAVRESLNSVAFHNKKDTLLKSAQRFTNRSANFFKSRSKVDKAKGFDMRSMKATIGFISKDDTDDQAVEDLQQQEHGGFIGGRKFVPVDPSRTGKSKSKNVRKNRRTDIFENSTIVSVKKTKGGSWGQKRIKAAIKAGVGGILIDHGSGKNGIVWLVDSLNRKGSNTKIKLTAIYAINPSGKVKVKATGFMRKSSTVAIRKMDKFYIREAEKQIKRLGAK